MLELRPYRVLEYLGDPADLVELLHPPRLPEDRSQFVRYARIAAQLADWDRKSQTKRSVSLEQPVFRGVRYGLVALESLSATVEVLPRDKEEPQRILEATQVHFRALLVDSSGRVLGGHEIFAAARAFQADMARPGKERASDYVLVAIQPETAAKSPNSSGEGEFDAGITTFVPEIGVNMWSLKDF